jgi:Type I restriction enzyme R protein N terminus (HSDR_N)
VGILQKCFESLRMLLSLDLLPLQSSVQFRKGDKDQMQVYDPIRKKYVALTPEELLRQLVLQYLLQVKQYPTTRIRSEIGIQVHGMPRRCDIVVFDKNVKPWLLVECKSPKVPLKQEVMEQAVRYNLELQVPYLVVTNGLQSSCAQMDYEQQSFQFLPVLPDWSA